MSTGNALLLVLAAVLVFVAAVLVAAEVSLSRVSRLAVEEMVRDGRRGAAGLAAVVAEPARYLNVLLLLRTFSELVATVLVAVVCQHDFRREWESVLVAGGAMTLISYVVVGVGPRTIARNHVATTAVRLAPLAKALTTALGPVPRVLIGLGNLLTPGRGLREGPFTSEAELRDLVDLATERRVIESDERQMIHSVFELGDTIAREVMVPRTDVVWIERTKTVRQALALALRSGFSRIPVIGESADDVVGVAYLKDLVRRVQDDGFTADGPHGAEKVDEVMRPPYLIPDSKPVDELLREMQARQVHVAVCIDEYGGTAGLVTIEDILEEIVGEIADEYDREGPRVEVLDEGGWRVTSRLPVDELEELVGVQFDPAELDDVETVGGLMAAALGRVPIPGTTVTVSDVRLTAEAGKGRRHQVVTVLVDRAPSS